MKNSIFVKNLRLHGLHGVMPEEKVVGHKLEIDIRCDLNNTDRPIERMADTVCYGEICDVAAEIVAGPSQNLLETLAEQIAAALFARFELIQFVAIEIRKPSAPVHHIFDLVGVSIERERA